MSEDSYPNMCIFNTLDGLRDGLSHFSQPSRVALIFAVGPDDPIRVYDPQNLLHGHEPILKEIYFDSDDWKKAAADLEMVRRFGQIQVEKNMAGGSWFLNRVLGSEVHRSGLPCRAAS